MCPVKNLRTLLAGKVLSHNTRTTKRALWRTKD